MKIKSKIDKAKDKLHICIDEYGTLHPKTIKQSKKVDDLIIKEQLEKLEEVKRRKGEVKL